MLCGRLSLPLTARLSQAYVKASNTGTSNFFGQSVDLSSDGSVLAVGALQGTATVVHFTVLFGESFDSGAPKENGGSSGVGGNQTQGSAFASGAVYVFSRMGATW